MSDVIGDTAPVTEAAPPDASDVPDPALSDLPEPAPPTNPQIRRRRPVALLGAALLVGAGLFLALRGMQQVVAQVPPTPVPPPVVVATPTSVPTPSPAPTPTESPSPLILVP